MMALVVGGVVLGLVVLAFGTLAAKRSLQEHRYRREVARIDRLAWETKREINGIVSRGVSALLNAVAQQQWRDRGHG